MPKFVVSGKFSPSNLEGLVTKRGGQSLKASTMWDANRVISDDDWTVRAMEQLFAADAALDDPLVDRFGTRVLDVDQAALLANPLVYLPLNESSGTPVNLGSLAVSPTLTGTTQGNASGYLSSAPGRPNYLVSGNTSTGINLGNTSALEFGGAASHSISCWIRQSVMDTSRYIIARFDAAPATGWRFLTDSTGRIQYIRGVVGASSGGVTAAGVLSLNTLYHVGVSYDGVLNRSRIFINGMLSKTTIHTTVPSLTVGTNGPTRQGTIAGSGTWNGEIGALAIYDVALPDWHFRAQWAAGIYGPA